MRQALIDNLHAKKAWELPLNLSLLPIQTEFICDFAHRFQAYGGGLGNGKSAGLITKVFLLSVCFPRNMGYLGRFDGKELKQTTMAELRRIVPEWMIEKSNDQLGYLKFKDAFGGSEIIYGDLKSERFNNLNLGWFAVDQAEEIDESRWNLLVSRLRRQTLLYEEDDKLLVDSTGQPLIPKTYGLAAFNPEGTSSYLWQYFHPDSPNRKPDYALYQASTFDGLAAGFISQDYVDAMLAVFPETARKRYLDGAWDVFEGRIYPQFSEQTHVLPSITVEPHWKLYETIDHGLTNPTAVLWIAVDELGNRFIVDEHYEGGSKSVKYHCDVIKAKREQFKQPVALSYLDSACWAKNQSKGDNVYAIVDEYNDNKIYPLPGQKDWGAGYNRILEALYVDPLHLNPFTGESGAPRIYVASHCRNFINEVLAYRWKKLKLTSAAANAPDKPQDLNDHAMDAWNYFEASRPAGAIVEKTETRNPLEILRERRAKWNPLDEEVGAGTWMSV